MTITYPIIVIGGGYLLNRFLFHQRLPLIRKWHFQWWPVAYAILADVLIYLVSWVVRTGFHSSVTTMNDWWLQLTFTVISAPLVEEYTFRGYIFGALDSIFNQTATIWIMSFIFSLIHLSSLGKAAWYNAVFLVVAYTTMGMFFTLVAVAAQSMWASFTAYVVNNLLIYRFIMKKKRHLARIAKFHISLVLHINCSSINSYSLLLKFIKKTPFRISLEMKAKDKKSHW